ncbi:MAG: flagellar biosynthesis anti-sigma factor FlgM [Chloroflexi bacterium]|nr:flagellar biosynthesis anti-sigma factor FlgM [Chloroflexota bacterium]
MDIERLSQRQNEPSVGEQSAARWAGRPANQPPKADAERTRFPSDTLEISDRSRELARARQAVDAAPDVRTEKVEAIKKRIEDGTYTVSPQLLARKLLEGTDGGI